MREKYTCIQCYQKSVFLGNTDKFKTLPSSSCMAQPAQKRKRRGVILSTYGWQRLQDAQEQLAISKNGGYAYTLAD
jgi:hypothetical protein